LVNAIAKIILREGLVSSETAANTSINGPLNISDAGIQLGLTKVFLRRKAFDNIERLRSHKMESSAVKLQSTIRVHTTRLFFHIQLIFKQSGEDVTSYLSCSDTEFKDALAKQQNTKVETLPSLNKTSVQERPLSF
jgi:myosin heavy subunit